MKLLSPALSQLARMRLGRIDYFMQYPLEIQDQWRHNLIASARSTEFGRQYGFSRIHTLQDYQDRVPIHDYEQIKPYIQRIMEGQQQVLWPSPIKWFAKSSGTTHDKSKFIPVSMESLDEGHYRAGRDVLSLYYKNNPESDLLTGKTLVIGGSHQVNRLSEDSFYGDLSAVMLQNMPFYGQLIKTPDLSIALMNEWEEKIEKIAHTTIHDKVTSIAGVPTWTLVLIKRILELTGVSDLSEIWPSLELYMHGGVSFIPYRQQFQKLIGSPRMRYLEIYNASEGFFGAQDRPQDEEGLLLFLNHGIYYEFMPFSELGSSQPRTLSLREVETGKPYALVISTNGGLWRYLVGDTIEFTTLFPFRVRVTGRTKSFLNAFGEEVIVENADQAIDLACRATGAEVRDYTAAPLFYEEGGVGAHEWLIEFELDPSSLETFTEVLDRTLQSINSDYEAKRYKDLALRIPRIQALPPGTFHQWLRSKSRLGGQHKIPRLHNDRRYLEEILGLDQA